MKERPLYTVHDLCLLADVSRKTLWYYDHAGLLRPVHRKGSQKAKLYDERSLKELNRIIRFRKAGLTISEIRSIQNADRNEMHQILAKALERLQDNQKELTAEIRLLKKIISEEASE